MAEKSGGVTGAFYAQLLLVIGIFIAGAMGFKWGVSEMRDVVKEEIKPLVEEIEGLKKDLKEKGELISDHEELLADNSSAIDNTTVSVNIFIDAFNRRYHTEFLRPVDITSESIVKEKYKKRKR